MDNQVERGKEWLDKLLSLMAMPASAIASGFETIPGDVDSCWLSVDGAKLTSEQTALLIGEKGENIDAIQYLANTLLNLNQEEDLQGSYTIELDGYRVKRHKELISLLDQAIMQVRLTGQEVELENLSSAERRQIHSFLQGSEDLSTESRGQEPHRKLIIRLQ